MVFGNIAGGNLAILIISFIIADVIRLLTGNYILGVVVFFVLCWFLFTIIFSIVLLKYGNKKLLK